MPQGVLQSYQLIITDLEMPKLNGYEVIRDASCKASNAGDADSRHDHSGR